MKNAEDLMLFVNAKFPMGPCVLTQGVGSMMREGFDPFRYLGRHLIGDWGDLDQEDKSLNDQAIKIGGRIFSAYDIDFTSKEGEPERRIYVITEADRSCTTILLPHEY